jgi:hypothetical protein
MDLSSPYYNNNHHQNYYNNHQIYYKKPSPVVEEHQIYYREPSPVIEKPKKKRGRPKATEKTKPRKINTFCGDNLQDLFPVILDKNGNKHIVCELLNTPGTDDFNIITDKKDTKYLLTALDN